MRRACLASFVVLLAAPAFAQPVTPIPPRHTRAPRNPTPAAQPAASTPTHGNSYIPAVEVQPVTTHKEGDYGGVTPGEAPPTDHPKPKHKPPAGTLSWIGFEAKDGGAQLFFQAIAPFDITQDVEGGVLVAHLGNLRTLGANAGRAIDTRFFDSPIARVEARHVGAAGATKTAPAHAAGLEVRVTFKDAKDAQQGTMKAQQEADGYYYVYLSFGAGADKATTPTAADPEK